MESKRIESARDALAYCVAGRATVTFRSTSTGVRFTYRIRQAEDKATGELQPLWFVKLLVGADNESSYQYLGLIRHTPAGYRYEHGRKSTISEAAPSANGFEWAFRALAVERIPPALEVWHNGQCGKCGRMLTVPESISAGLGPKCRARFEAEAA
jgi:hypothetical protein